MRMITFTHSEGLPERIWPISEEYHLKYYSIKFLFRWKDVPALDIFGKTDKLFKWCEAFYRYNNIKVSFFHPEWFTWLCLHTIIIKYRSTGLLEDIDFTR